MTMVSTKMPTNENVEYHFSNLTYTHATPFLFHLALEDLSHLEDEYVCSTQRALTHTYIYISFIQ